METITVDNDIKVMYVNARSFPDGIMEAFEKIHALVPPSSQRRLFGISRPENGVVVYKAAIEEIRAGEAAQLKCDTITLKKGKYISEAIHDYMNDIPIIGCTFREMLAYPGLDPQGYCVEWYLNDKELKCMIRLAE